MCELLLTQPVKLSTYFYSKIAELIWIKFRREIMGKTYYITAINHHFFIPLSAKARKNRLFLCSIAMKECNFFIE